MQAFRDSPLACPREYVSITQEEVVEVLQSSFESFSLGQAELQQPKGSQSPVRSQKKMIDSISGAFLASEVGILT